MSDLVQHKNLHNREFLIFIRESQSYAKCLFDYVFQDLKDRHITINNWLSLLILLMTTVSLCIHAGGSEGDSECQRQRGQTDGSAWENQTEKPLRQADYCILECFLNIKQTEDFKRDNPATYFFKCWGHLGCSLHNSILKQEYKLLNVFPV